MTNLVCPVCGAQSRSTSEGGDRYNYDCPRCGLFGLTGTAKATLPHLLNEGQYRDSLLSYSIRKMQNTQHWPLLGSDLVKALVHEKSLPKPAEQARNLLIWLGNDLPSPETAVEVSLGALQSIVGAATTRGAMYVLKHLADGGLIHSREPSPTTIHLGLTFTGWEEFERLQRVAPDSRIAFMAMQFNDQELNKVVDTIFRPAVEQTGFELRILSDTPRAGLIDDRLRVEIRQARFVIADLTHRNPGAYWEAGFAEGLGKPVIYTCKKEAFDAQASHFDTNHHLTIMWNVAALAQAGEDLKNTIRATLPDEAKMND